jgi:hypothetical protein
MITRDRYAPPDKGLPLVESVCDNGHRFAGELAWKLTMVFPKDIALTVSCPDCGKPLRIVAGSYEPTGPTGVYVRTGLPDPSVVMIMANDN